MANWNWKDHDRGLDRIFEGGMVDIYSFRRIRKLYPSKQRIADGIAEALTLNRTGGTKVATTLPQNRLQKDGTLLMLRCWMSPHVKHINVSIL
jgi:uncharacterized protein YcaQ